MKTRAAWLVVLVFGIIWARTGGPDLYGYMFKDSDEPDVNFEWIDTTGGTLVPFDTGADDQAVPVVLPFSFQFYGETYDSVWVSTNGLLSFTGDNADEYSNEEIPSLSTPNAIIAPLWDDQKYVDTTDIGCYMVTGGSAPNRWVAFIWYNWYHLGFYNDTWTYEVILYETPSGDGSIAMQYLDVVLADSEGIDSSYSLGASATVGIENADGSDGLLYSYNEPALRDSLRIEFYVVPPAEHDLGFISVLSPVGTVVNMFDVVPEAVIRNYGASDESDVDVFCSITGAHSGLAYSGTLTVSIPAGEVDTVEFPSISGLAADTYTVSFAVALASDSRPDNDTISAGFVMLEHLGYGGPDDFGYMWYDNFYSGSEAPEFAPIDTSEAEVILSSGDDVVQPVELPFAFPFYGETIDSIWVTSNGVIATGAIDYAPYSNEEFPTSDFPGAIAPFWDDLVIDDSVGAVYMKEDTEDGVDVCRIIFSKMRTLGISAYLTFQVSIYENGDIKFEYDDFSPPSEPRLMGNSATVGLSAPDSSTGIQYEYNGAPVENPVVPGMAILFKYPGGTAEDTIPPIITYEPDSIVWICDAEGMNVSFDVSVRDVRSGVASCSLYYSLDGASYEVIAPSEHDGDDYLFLIPGLNDGDEIHFYFAATDENGNRATLPAAAPDSAFVSVVGDIAHSGENPASFMGYCDLHAEDCPYGTIEFNWIEIDPDEGGAGTVLDSAGDDWISELLSWNMPFKICSNGWITFDSTEIYAARTGEFGDPGSPNRFIAPLFADLTPFPEDTTLPTGKIIYFISSYYDSVVIEWKNMYLYGTNYSATFELVLKAYADGPTEAYMYYLNVDPEVANEMVGVGVEGPISPRDTIPCSFLTYIYPHGDDIYPPNCAIYDSAAVKFYFEDWAVREKVPTYVEVGDIKPNPFNSSAAFTIKLDRPAVVEAGVYDCAGHRVATLADGRFAEGEHLLRWDAGADVPSGVYFVRIKIDGTTIVRRAMLVR